jgi:hypothetical protein
VSSAGHTPTQQLPIVINPTLLKEYLYVEGSTHKPVREGGSSMTLMLMQQCWPSGPVKGMSRRKWEGDGRAYTSDPAKIVIVQDLSRGRVNQRHTLGCPPFGVGVRSTSDADEEVCIRTGSALSRRGRGDSALSQQDHREDGGGEDVEKHSVPRLVLRFNHEYPWLYTGDGQVIIFELAISETAARQDHRPARGSGTL